MAEVGPFPVFFDFGAGASYTEGGVTVYTPNASTSYSTPLGWTSTTGLANYDWSSGNNYQTDLVYRTGISPPNHIFRVDLPDGDYDVTVYFFIPSSALPSNARVIEVFLDGNSMGQADVSTGSEVTLSASSHATTDGYLEIEFDYISGTGNNWLVNGIRIEEAGGGTEATANPDPLDIGISFPAQTVTAIEEVATSPSPLAVGIAFPEPAVDAVEEVTEEPNPLGIGIAFPEPTATAIENVSTSPSSLAIAITFPSPTVSADGASVAQPDPLLIGLAFPEPTVSAVEEVSTAPSPLTLGIAFPTPTVTAEGSESTASPNPLSLGIVFPSPTVVAVEQVNVAPNPLIVGIEFPEPTVTALTGDEPTVANPPPLQIGIRFPTPVVVGTVSPIPDESFSVSLLPWNESKFRLRTRTGEYSPMENRLLHLQRRQFEQSGVKVIYRRPGQPDLDIFAVPSGVDAEEDSLPEDHDVQYESSAFMVWADDLTGPNGRFTPQMGDEIIRGLRGRDRDVWRVSPDRGDAEAVYTDDTHLMWLVFVTLADRVPTP